MSKNSLTLWQRLKNLLSRQMRASYQTPAHQNAAKHPCETTHSTADNVQLASNAAFDNSADHNMEAGVMTTQESEAPITYQAIESLLTDMGYQFYITLAMTVRLKTSTILRCKYRIRRVIGVV